MKKYSTVYVVGLLLMSVLFYTASAQDYLDSSGPFSPASSASLTKASPNGIAGQWSKCANLPVSMGYNTAVYFNNAIYNFSGLTATTLLTDVYRLDLSTNVWEKVAQLPKARPLAMSIVLEDKIYLIGGYSSGSPFTTEATVLVFDPATNTITEKAAMPVPVYAAGCFVHENRIWILGGGTTSFSVQTDVIQIYDPASDTWVRSTSKLPLGLRSFSAVNIKGVPYFIGGYAVAGTQGVFYPQMYKGAINGDEVAWTKLQDFPGGAIMRYAMGTDGTILYLTGGFTALSAQTGVMSNLTWAYNPSVDAWRNEVMKPTPVSYGSNFIYDGEHTLYQLGGQTNDNSYVDAVEAYDFQAASKPDAVLSSTGTSFWAKRANNYRGAFYLGNIGGDDLIWSAQVDQDAVSWLSIDGSVNGTILPAGQSMLVFSVQPSSLDEGRYEGVLRITTNDSENSTLTYTVQITVQEKDVDEPVNVLVEQYTGTWCQYCPFGADSLAALTSRFGERIVRTSWHDNDPMMISSWSNMQKFIGVAGFPTASINRIAWPGSTTLPVSRSDWGTYAAYVLNNMPAPVGIQLLDKSYNQTTKSLNFKVKVFFHQSIDADLRLNALITEDNLNYEQVKYTSTGNIRVNPYYHLAVVRGVWPDIQGMPLSSGTAFTTQSTVTKEFSFNVPQVIDGNSHIVLYVHKLYDGKPGPVLQSFSEPLITGPNDVERTSAPTDFVLDQNYPNPFNPSTTISFGLPVRSDVKITLTNTLGRSFDTIVDGTYEAGTHKIIFHAGDLPSGNYFMTMTVGDVVLTRNMTLIK